MNYKYYRIKQKCKTYVRIGITAISLMYAGDKLGAAQKVNHGWEKGKATLERILE